VLDGRRQLSFRCAEYHQVLPAGGLPIKEHYDAGSLITLDLMLSETGDFAGGVFATLEADGELKEHAFERGDLIVFASHKYHCVSPVSRGLRRVLVAEIWEGVERRCPGRCHVPWGPCNCLLEPENLHVLRRDGPVQLTATPTFAYTPLAPGRRSLLALDAAAGEEGVDEDDLRCGARRAPAAEKMARG